VDKLQLIDVGEKEDVASSPLKERCAECKFFLTDNGGHYCRRYPPTMAMLMAAPQVALSANRGSTPMPVSSYPPIQRNQWCGEYKRKLDA